MTTPLPITDLADLLPIAKGLWEPSVNQEMSGTGGSEILVSDLDVMVWVSEVETMPVPLADLARLRAIVAGLGISRRPFYYYSPESRWPALDPRGALLEGYTPTISAVDFSEGTIDVSGLPPHYRLSVGDMVAYDYGTPSRRYLGAFAADLESSAGGVVLAARLTPSPRPGTVSTTTLALVKPAAKVVIVPKTLSVRERGGKHGTIGFRVQQTLRAG